MKCWQEGKSEITGKKYFYLMSFHTTAFMYFMNNSFKLKEEGRKREAYNFLYAYAIYLGVKDLKKSDQITLDKIDDEYYNLMYAISEKLSNIIKGLGGITEVREAEEEIL